MQKSRVYVGKYYEVNDIVLGRGSFSTVYLAIHKVFGTKVALKVIDKNNIQEEYVLRNLHREANILRKLNHPNIVNFYEEFTHNELYCLSLEHIDGPDLSRYLKKQPFHRVSEKTAKVMFYQMISAVHHMHQANILHRDLKQENILLEYGKVIKIVDFGLSNTYQPKVHLRTHCGSLVYAAPELFQYGSVYGAGVDLWSLGVILYAMVVGRIPFEVSKDGKSIISNDKKELFLKRISKGLTAENWKNMEHLSCACANLLSSLLQPDQFKRIIIEGVRNHSWFVNDEGLRKRLPQHRMDLKRKFEPEIIEIMADRLHKQKGFLRLHLATKDKYDRVSAMYFILQDTLVKEVLYPPKDLENTLIYQQEHKRKCQIFARRKLTEKEQDQEHDEANESSKCSVEQSVHSFSTGESKFDSRCFVNQVSGKHESKKGSRGSITNIRKSIGDGGHVENKTSERIVSRRKPWMPTSNNPSSIVKSSIPQKTDNQRLKSTYTSTDHRLKSTYPSTDHRLKSTYTSTDHRFRSYKNSRPIRVVKDQKLNERSEERSDFENGAEENGEISHSSSDFSNYSMKYNFQREVDALKGRFEKNCSIASQNVDQRGYNLRNQRRTATVVSNSGYSQPTSVKCPTDVDKYTDARSISNSVYSQPTSVKCPTNVDKYTDATSISNSVYSQTTSVKRPSDVDKYTAQQIKQIQRTFDLRLNTNEASIKSTQRNPIYNKKPFQVCPAIPTVLSNNQKQSSQMKQRSMVIRRSNASNTSQSSNKTEISRHQYRPQQTYVQRPAFDASKNKSIYESRRMHKTAPAAVSKKENPAKK